MKTSLLFKAGAAVLMALLIYSCDRCKPQNKDGWTEAEKHAIGMSTHLKCGDSLQIHLSKGDSIFVHPEGVSYAGMCHVEMGFRHKLNGTWQNDRYQMETDKWEIAHDSTNVTIKCVPANDNECQFMLKTKKKR